MHSHTLQLRELQRQELLAEAAYERTLLLAAPAAPAATRGIRRGIVEMPFRISSVLARLRPVLHVRSAAVAR